MAPRSLVTRAIRLWLLKDMGTSNKQPGAGSPATLGAMQYLPHRARRGLTCRRNPHHLFSRKLVRSSPRQRPITLLIGIDHAEINKGSQGTNGLVPRGHVFPGVLTGTSILVLRSSRGPLLAASTRRGPRLRRVPLPVRGKPPFVTPLSVADSFSNGPEPPVPTTLRPHSCDG